MAVLDRPKEQLEDGECYATGFRGSKGSPFKNTIFQPRRNTTENINGVDYSGHSLDQMQNRGIMPSVVENTITNGETFDAGDGAVGHYDPVNNITVIRNHQAGRIITVIPGEPKR